MPDCKLTHTFEVSSAYHYGTEAPRGRAAPCRRPDQLFLLVQVQSRFTEAFRYRSRLRKANGCLCGTLINSE
jgi:hypothetical protein